MRTGILKIFTAAMAAVLLSGCGSEANTSSNPSSNTSGGENRYEHELNIIDDNYRNYYEIFVYSFCDSDGDGIGDLNGVTSKLDYISDMGFNGIWLMPIMPSTTYHKYNVRDYYDIDPQYGTMEDFENLAAECDKRGIKLLIDLVMNHSGKDNEWFKSAAKSVVQEPCGASENETCLSEQLCPVHNPYVDYYHFVDKKPAGTNTYYSVGNGKYYEAVFSDNMPELQLDNPDVRKEFEKIAEFWLNKGAGGFRLDAAKEYFSGNPDKNSDVLKWFTDYCKSVKSDCYIVAEVWESFSTYTKYYSSGIDSVFGFTMAQEDGKIAKTINNAGEANSVRSFAQAMTMVEDKIASYSESSIDAPFIGNHDTNRAAGILRYDPVKIKSAAGLLLTMSGSPFVYYGDEIGLSGSGRDENKRAPMIWDESGSGLTKGPSNLEQENVNNRFESVEKQLADPDSILNYYKRALRIRNENPCIARGKTEVVNITGQDVAAVNRTWNDQNLTIVYNYSDEEKTISDASLALEDKELRNYLTIESAQEVSLNDGLTMPPYSIAFLSQKSEG